jgi:hypothetical protein
MAFKISNLQPTGTVRFVLTGVRTPAAASDVALILKHAGKGNPRWEAARRKIDSTIRARAGAAADDDVLDALISPFAQFVIDGWEDCTDEDGKDVPFTAAKGEEFLRYVIAEGGSDIVNQAVGFSLLRANFRDYQPVTAEELGKK